MERFEAKYEELKKSMNEVMGELLRDALGSVDSLMNVDDEDFKQIKKVMELYDLSLEFADESMRLVKDQNQMLKDILDTVKKLEKEKR